MLWKSRVGAQERTVVCSGALLLGTWVKWGRQRGWWCDLSVRSSPWGRIQISPLTRLMPPTGLFHSNWSFPHYFFTPGRHTVFCGAHQPRQVWCAGMLKGQNPSRLPRDFHRQVSLTRWLVGPANWEGCVRGQVSCPGRGSMAGFISAFIKCDFF